MLLDRIPSFKGHKGSPEVSLGCPVNATRGNVDHIPSKPDVELELEGRMDIKQQLHVNCNNEDILENNLELDLNDQ